MKGKIKKFFSLVLCGVIFSSTAMVVSASTIESDFEALKKDILSVTDEQTLKEIYESNPEWIEDVNTRLENYLSQLTEREKNEAMAELLGRDTNSRAYSGNFDWYSYTYRGGHWTYNMYPKVATRWLRPVANEGFNEIYRAYGNFGDFYNSLYNQYICHFDSFFEMEWNIEKGRPDVGYWNTIIALCNP